MKTKTHYHDHPWQLLSRVAATWVRRYPLLSFYTLAFGLTWGNWVPRALASRGLIELEVPDFLSLIAGYGPALAAMVVTGIVDGPQGLGRLGRRLLLWRVSIRWYAVVLVLPTAQALAALGLHLAFGGELISPAERSALPVASAGMPLGQWMLSLFLMFTLGFDGLGEELGWRGFALPRLLERNSALAASLVLGGLWVLWHLPYALTAGSAMADRPFYEHVPSMLASGILFTWIFNHTRGSILLAILFHAAGNVTVNALPELIPGVYGSGIWGHIVPSILAIAVVAIEGPAHLSRENCQWG